MYSGIQVNHKQWCKCIFVAILEIMTLLFPIFVNISQFKITMVLKLMCVYIKKSDLFLNI